MKPWILAALMGICTTSAAANDNALAERTEGDQYAQVAAKSCQPFFEVSALHMYQRQMGVSKPQMLKKFQELLEDIKGTGSVLVMAYVNNVAEVIEEVHQAPQFDTPNDIEAAALAYGQMRYQKCLETFSF